jgi:hypothetical protein
MKPKIVEFSDGTYAVRKFRFEIPPRHYEYKSLKDDHWWNAVSTFFSDCKGTLVECQEMLGKLSAKKKKRDYGKAVPEHENREIQWPRG